MHGETPEGEVIKNSSKKKIYIYVISVLISDIDTAKLYFQ